MPVITTVEVKQDIIELVEWYHHVVISQIRNVLHVGRASWFTVLLGLTGLIQKYYFSSSSDIQICCCCDTVFILNASVISVISVYIRADTTMLLMHLLSYDNLIPPSGLEQRGRCCWCTCKEGTVAALCRRPGGIKHRHDQEKDKCWTLNIKHKTVRCKK